MGKKSVSQKTKWQIAGLLKDKSKTNVDIANLCGVSEYCVRQTKKKLERTGDVKDLPRPGRPSKLSYRDVNYLFRLTRQDPKISYQELADNLNSKLKNICVSRHTVRRELIKRDIDCYVSIRKPLLTVMDRVKRRKWCRERLHWTIEDWARVIFSDESNFEVINRKSRILVKRLKSEKYLERFCTPRVQGGGGSVGIWGCIAHKGTGVEKIYTGRMNQYLYQDTLENCLIPSVDLLYESYQRWIFQQDGASAHTANTIKLWLNENKVEVLPWCARSPDLNPMENIWSYIDRKLVKLKMESVEQLKEQLEELWRSIPKELPMRLIESMPRRVRACYKAKGGSFNY